MNHQRNHKIICINIFIRHVEQIQPSHDMKSSYRTLELHCNIYAKYLIKWIPPVDSSPTARFWSVSTLMPPEHGHSIKRINLPSQSMIWTKLFHKSEIRRWRCLSLTIAIGLNILYCNCADRSWPMYLNHRTPDPSTTTTAFRHSQPHKYLYCHSQSDGVKSYHQQKAKIYSQLS